MTTAFVYKWTHLPTLMWYIGSRTKKGCNPDDGYICSSAVVKPLIKANPSEWRREIIEIGDPVSIRLFESEILVCLDASRDPRSFNQINSDGKFSNAGKIASIETRKKRSRSHKKYWATHTHPAKGKKLTEEHKAKLVKARTGRKFSEESKKKKSETLKKRYFEQTHHSKGRKMSEERLNKQRKPIQTPLGQFGSLLEAAQFYLDQGLVNARYKIIKWMKSDPNNFYYLQRSK